VRIREENIGGVGGEKEAAEDGQLIDLFHIRLEHPSTEIQETFVPYFVTVGTVRSLGRGKKEWGGGVLIAFGLTFRKGFFLEGVGPLSGGWGFLLLSGGHCREEKKLDQKYSPTAHVTSDKKGRPEKGEHALQRRGNRRFFFDFPG